MTSAQEQYRSIVRHYLQGGQISPAAQRILQQQRSYLNLLTDEAEAIEQSVLEGSSEKEDNLLAKDALPAAAIPTVEDIAPVQESAPAEAIPTVEDSIVEELTVEELTVEEISPDAENGGTDDRPPESQANQVSKPPNSESDLKSDPESDLKSDPESASRYKAAYSQAVRLLFLPNKPLNELLEMGLRSLQQTLNLQEDEVKAIETRCLAEFETEEQKYQEKLNLYREEFASARFSLHRQSVQDELWQLQDKLGLRGEDVLKLERDVMQENVTEADRDLLTMNRHSSDLARNQAIEKELFNDIDTVARSGQGRKLRPHTDPQKIVLQAAGDPENDLTDRDATDQPMAGDASMSLLHGDDFTAEQSGSQTANANLDGSHRSKDAAESVSRTVLESVPQTELDFAFQELERHLSRGSRDWWEADQTTYQILLKLSPHESLGWLDTASIDQIYRLDALQRIDRLWSAASEGRFGLSAQREVYSKVEQDLRLQYQDKMKDDRLQQLYIQEFVRAIGWWDSRLKFVKFYKWLSFESDLTIAPDIPQGQFPAYWFWVIPRPYALKLGGIGFGQGGWRIDTLRMRAWLDKLRNCKFEPYQN